MAVAIIISALMLLPCAASAKKKNTPDVSQKSSESQDGELKEIMEQYLKQFKVPYGAFVAIEPSSGKVLAAVEFTQDKNRKKPLYLDNIFPAASVFKIITSAALLESGGANVGTKVCYHGGSQRLMSANIKDNPKKDKSCKSLRDGFAFSTNALFGKLALKHLSQETLKEYAAKFGFNQKPAFELPLKFGTANIPSDDLSFARTAAGFANVTLSPIHGALIAAAIANGGWMPFPVFEGAAEPEKKELLESVTQETAGKIKAMMVATSVYGTARKYFKNRSVYLKGIGIATKTGSL
ncbi:MAG: hypothetical protein FJ088_09545, partial [Deltaproteobacteria bacterium]|nr:hypothetical protein [Deltaproteobacteria bacterium]